MMIVCPACGEEIEFVSIKKNFGFTLGNVKIDLDPQDKSVIRGTMIDLPCSNNLFDTL